MKDENKRKHRKFFFSLLICFIVAFTGLSGYAMATGQMPQVLQAVSSIFSPSAAGTAAKPKTAELQAVNSNANSAINPNVINPSNSIIHSTSSSTSSADPDAKVDAQIDTHQGGTVSVEPMPISISQDSTSTSSAPAANTSSKAPTPPKPTPKPSSSSSTTSSSSASSSSSVPITPTPYSPGGSMSVPITGITLDKTTLTLNKGETSEPLKATITPSNTTISKAITWKTDNPAIVTVDQTGKVAAVGAGTTQVDAKTSNGKVTSCTVTVLVPPTGIKINSENFSLDKGSSKTLTAALEPADCTDTSVVWTTSDSNIVSIDSTGKVTGVNPGKAVITVKTLDEKYSATCEIACVISISSLKLDQAEVTVIKGSQATLKATIDPPDTTEDKTIHWSSTNPAAATVDNNGTITAVEGGVTTVAAQAGSHVAECTVTVTVPATGVSLNESELRIPIGSDKTLIATVLPEDTTDKVVAWTSSDESIATVDSFSGKVTGVKVGKAVITATTHDGSFTASCNVMVVIPTTGITISQRTLNLVKGNTTALTATVLPEEATDQAVIWSTSDPAVVTVDSSGQVTAIGGGLATITVKSHDGNFKTECTVTVTVPAAGISLNKTALKLAKGTSEKLSAQFSPADTTDKGVLWTSSDESVATVDGAGKISAVNVGSTVISAKTHDGGFTASCNVAVVIPVTGIALDKTDLTLSRGSTDLLKATINPSDATDQAVTWLSSNPSVAGIDQYGNITAAAAGHTVISVTAHDGSFVAQCNLTVFVPIESISLNQTTADLLLGENTSLTVSINPADTTDDTAVTWMSSNSSVATVDESGKVTAIAVGQANITATVGKFTVSCTVTASDKTVPSAPQNLKASISGSSVIYSFSAPLNNGNTPILGYNAYKNGSKVNTSLLTATSITVPVSGTSTDQIKVTAVNAIGESEALSGTAKVSQNTQYWTTNEDYQTWEVVGSHHEWQPTSYGAVDVTVDDYGWVTHTRSVDHSSIYYTVQLV